MSNNEDPSYWVGKQGNCSLGRHHAERIRNGFSEYDWWNFHNYIAWVNIQALEKFKTGHGCPGELADKGGMDEWIVILDKMIDGFKASLSLSSMDYMELDDDVSVWKPKEDALIEAQKAGMELYTKYFNSLWD